MLIWRNLVSSGKKSGPDEQIERFELQRPGEQLVKDPVESVHKQLCAEQVLAAVLDRRQVYKQGLSTWQTHALHVQHNHELAHLIDQSEYEREGTQVAVQAPVNLANIGLD